jgi:TRAP-type C4-dicarboxylate transport system substrate-binding protein
MKIRGMMSLIMISLLTLMAIGLASSAEAAGKDKVYQMKIGYVGPPKMMGGYRGTFYFAEEVFARTKGHVKIVPIIGKNRENLNKVVTGVHQGDYLGTSIYTDIARPKWGILEMPFIWSDYDRIEKFRKSELFKPIVHALEDKGLEVLAMACYGIMDFQTLDTPANTLEELAKLKYRMSGTNIQIRSMQRLGIKSQLLPFPEVYAILKQRVLDGTIISADGVNMGKWQELLKYYVNFPVFNGWLDFVANVKWIKSLPPEYANIIREAAYKMQEREVHQQRYRDDYMKALFMEKGMKFIDMAPGEIEKSKELVRPIYEEFANQPGVGKDYFNKVMELIGEKMRL